MVTYLELRGLDPRVFTAMAVWFRVLAARLQEWSDAATDSVAELRRDWSGPAGRAALDRGGGLGRRLVEASARAGRCDQLLTELADRLDRAKALLADAERLATASAGTDVEREIEAALRLAHDADRSTADGLRSLAVVRDVAAPVAAPSPGGPGSVALPDAAATPAQVYAYWAGLTEPQRSWLINYRSADVGGLDGIPAADRDLANRLVLASERDRLLALRGSTSDPPPMAEVNRIDGQLRGLDAIDSRLRDFTLSRAYLLSLSTVDDGRAIIAVGNPDRATDVVTDIPGAGSDLSTVDALIARADALNQAAVRLSPQHRMAVISWLGYDPPDGVGAAAAWSAHDAEPALDAFADGLRATHEGPRSHNTVVGHSYGSLVAGVTARDRGLDTDDLVFVGSAGVGVDRAADLGLPVSAIWSSTAADDPVQRFAPGWGQLAMDLAANAVAPFAAWYGDPKPDRLLWHGLNPSTPAFGGQVFASDPDGGHNGYWQGAALDGIAHIAIDREAPPA